jgi:hypothetical protein
LLISASMLQLLSSSIGLKFDTPGLLSITRFGELWNRGKKHITSA